MMTVHSIQANGHAIYTMDVDCPAWLPVRPRIRIGWFRFLVSAALRQYFATPLL